MPGPALDLPSRMGSSSTRGRSEPRNRFAADFRTPPGMKMIIRIIVLLVLPILGLAASRAADPGSAKFSDEVSKQESIYRSDGEQTVEGYTVDRSLSVYTDALPPASAPPWAMLAPAVEWWILAPGKAKLFLNNSIPATT